MSGIWQRQLSDTLKTVPRFALYSDTGLDDLSQTGPFLISCPEPEGVEARALCNGLNGLTRSDHRFVSWIWTTHDIEPLIGHLQTLLHARLGPDDGDAWFFFHQPAYLPVLHRELPEPSRRYMFGPCLAWWCLDPRGELVELAGENLPLPAAWDAFPVPGEVVSALHRAGAPAQVRAWLQKVMPALLDRNDANAQLQQLTPLAEQAFAYGITGKTDLGVYAAHGLQYGARYDDHPALQGVLTQFRAGDAALIDAYAALGSGVWKEVQETARQRAAEAAAQAHQDKLRKYGYAKVRTRIINRTEHRKWKVGLIADHGNIGFESALADELPGGVYSDEEIDLPAVNIPIPGTQAVVKWTGQAGRENSDEFVVTGELPRAEGEGLVIVQFARDFRVYVRMYAEEPKPARQW
ncbi:DUF4123 domain-containing protein [Paraburkholderia sp. SIMBA_030]|uniref:DUF4123 domain-containing protein n=1 Tax=Paraburkholderia sp. SIMBA_030 TaxID=3085773 RepID=UPI003979F9A4